MLYAHIYIYIYIYVRRPRDNPLSGHVSRAPRCRTPIRPAIYADRAWRRRGGGPPRLNTEYENVCRLEFDFATDRSEVRGGSFPALSLSNQITFPSLRKIFLLLRGQRRRKGGRRRVIRAISGTTEEISAVADHRPLPPWKVFVGRCSSGQSSYTFDNVR